VDQTTPSPRLKRQKSFQNSRGSKTLRICIVYPQGNHITGDCRIFIDRYARKGKKEDNKKKDEDNMKDKGFQQPKRTVALIFSGVLGFRSKHQDKLALRSIMAAEPAVPRYLNWSQYPI
jgi:hypothetical protein